MLFPQLAQRVLANAAPGIIVLLMLSVFVFGYLMAFGDMSLRRGMTHILRIAFVGMLTGATGFAQWIQQPLTTQLPAEVNALFGSNAALTVAQQCDTLASAVRHFESVILLQAVGIEWLGQFLAAQALAIATLFCLLAVYFAYAAANVVLGLVLVLAPAIIGFYVFDATRHVVNGLIGVAAGALIWMASTIVILQVAIAICKGVIIYVQNNPPAGTAGATVVDDEINQLAMIFCFFLVSALLVVITPGIAAKIGGGVASGINNSYSRQANAVAGAGKAVGRTVNGLS